MKSQCFPPLFILPCPGASEQRQNGGAGARAERGRCPKAGLLGAAAAVPSGPRPGGTGRRGGPNFSGCSSRRGRPATKLPRHLIEIFFFFFFFFSGSSFSPPLSGNFRHRPARHGATSSANKAALGAARGGGGKETRASRLRRRRP